MDRNRSTAQHTRARGTGHGLATADGPQLERIVSDALFSQRGVWLVARVRRSARGRSLLAARPHFVLTNRDLHELLRLPHGTFGYELAAWMLDSRLVSPLDSSRDDDHGRGLGLERGLEKGLPAGPKAGAETYLGHRLVDVHDLWHVLSGYNIDLAGELGMLAFTLGQGHAHAVGPALARLARRFRDGDSHAGPCDSRERRNVLYGYLWRAYRRGHKARFLVSLRLEDYFSLPIDTARQRLGIEPCTETLVPEALPPIALRPAKEMLRVA